MSRGEKVSKQVESSPMLGIDLSDQDLSAVSAWIWVRQHTYDSAGRSETNDVDRTYRRLTPHDQARVASMLVLFDTNAYLRVKQLRSVRTEEFMNWLASERPRDLTVQDLAAEAKRRFGISSPEVLDATMIYIGYQLRCAFLLAHPMIRPDLLVVHGWASPVVDVQPWAQSYLGSTRLRVEGSSLVMSTQAMQAVGGLLQGIAPRQEMRTWFDSSLVSNYQVGGLTQRWWRF